MLWQDSLILRKVKEMTFEELQKANATIKTTQIKNKNYAEVPQRIKAFRMVCPNGKIHTEILSIENGVVIMKATVFDDEGRELGTGTAYEREDNGFINSTSYIENCETSAVGRALGICGFGIDVSVASAEEVQNAITQQELAKQASEAKIDTLKSLCEKHKIDSAKWLKDCGRTWTTLTEGEATKMLLGIKKKYGDD